jgi:hypothetical protein
MGHPSTFFRSLQTMYSIAGMSILNETKVAGVVTDIQSVRQGCPLIVHLFVLFIEPLLVRLSKDVNGISFFNEKLPVRAIVDNVTIFIACDEYLTRTKRVLDFLCKLTKAKMNKEKTKTMGLGA